MRFGPLLCALLAVPAGAASATDKESPDFLRNRHAGAATFTSPETPKDLYPRVLRAMQDCRLGPVKPVGNTAANYGALGAMASVSASREVVGELSPDGESAVVMVRAIGFFGAVKDNFLQLDLKRENDITRVEAFHGMNVKGQRTFLVEVAHWLKGEWTYCEPDIVFNRKPKESR